MSSLELITINAAISTVVSVIVYKVLHRRSIRRVG